MCPLILVFWGPRSLERKWRGRKSWGNWWIWATCHNHILAFVTVKVEVILYSLWRGIWVNLNFFRIMFNVLSSTFNFTPLQDIAAHFPEMKMKDSLFTIWQPATPSWLLTNPTDFCWHLPDSCWLLMTPTSMPAIRAINDIFSVYTDTGTHLT